MNTDNVLSLLKNSGLRVLGADGSFIYIEDPSCIVRSFETFTFYAWAAITLITGILLFGWAISMIRGAKNDIFTNLRNLILMFGTLSAVGAIVNFIYGDDLFKRGCRTIKVSQSEVNELLNARNKTLGEYDQFEEFNIYDSGAQNTDTYAENPVRTSGAPADVSVTVTPDNNSALPPAAGTDADAPQPETDEDTNTPTTETTPPPPVAEDGRDVIYANPDGTRTRKTGGSRAWRNNNPGNLRYTEFSVRMGAIGQAGKFAVFPDKETGQNALRELLKTKTYYNLSVADAISRYAPPSQNNTARYHARIKELTGVSLNKKLNQLSNAEMERVVGAISTIEGWTVGQTIPYNETIETEVQQ